MVSKVKTKAASPKVSSKTAAKTQAKPVSKTSVKPSSKTSARKKVCLALQGGGAHGAFAWGVADRLLEDGRFDIVAVSGTSAGGMNAASLMQGLIQGGNNGARAMMEAYWKAISEMGKNSPFKTTPIDDMMGYHNLDRSPSFLATNALTQNLSPYQTNPTNKNPFKDFLAKFFDFSVFKKNTQHKIFLGATHVKTGKIKVFSNKDMSADVLMASACLPFMFQAVEIDGEDYWDGGFIANPAIYPLIEVEDSKDIIIVQLTKSHCDELPKTKDEIVDRLKEITYNGCLVREMRAIYFITQLIDKGLVKDGALKRINMHVIKSEKTFKNLKLSSALNTKWEFLTMLRDAGREAASEWLEKHHHKIGSDNHEIDEDLFKDFMS